MQACEEVFTAFCDLMDEGEVDSAVELHTEDLEFYDVGRDEPMRGREPLRTRLKKVRFSYPGRKTLHTPSNFRFHEVTERTAECRVIIALMDVVRMPGGKGIGANSTELLGYAEEEVRFALDSDGCWRFQARQGRVSQRRQAVAYRHSPQGPPLGQGPMNDSDYAGTPGAADKSPGSGSRCSGRRAACRLLSGRFRRRCRQGRTSDGRSLAGYWEAYQGRKPDLEVYRPQQAHPGRGSRRRKRAVISFCA